LVTNHIARNHIRSGLRVSWNTVPAVSDVSHSQARHRNRPRDIPHGSAATPHSGHREPVRPTQAADVLPASSVATKPLIHLLERPWIIDSRNGVARSLHRIFVPPKLAGVKGIPIFRNSGHPRGSEPPTLASFPINW